MASIFTKLTPQEFPQEVTLSATINTITRIDLPPWVGTIIVTPRANAAYKVQDEDAVDGAVAHALVDTVTLPANEARTFRIRCGPARTNYDEWPPSIYIASGTASVVVEIECEPW